ncbi:hypothetical protein ZIOFF_072130 [Zingiber officinale]|uniref:Dof zinc finger protein n=1 Tax=Zingiber officinale TaxID=94328 RepID=A0A8J5CAL6_ZINOF|nr:hypothetical protein ZIOFF_072130 [Zingiber officinale]
MRLSLPLVVPSSPPLLHNELGAISAPVVEFHHHIDKLFDTGDLDSGRAEQCCSVTLPASLLQRINCYVTKQLSSEMASQVVSYLGKWCTVRLSPDLEVDRYVEGEGDGDVSCPHGEPVSCPLKAAARLVLMAAMAARDIHLRASLWWSRLPVPLTPHHPSVLSLSFSPFIFFIKRNEQFHPLQAGAVVATILLLSLSLTPISATSPRDSSPLSATFSHYLYAPFPSLPTAPTVLRGQRKGLEKGRGRMERDGGERLSMCSSSPSSPGKKWPQLLSRNLPLLPFSSFSDLHLLNPNSIPDPSPSLSLSLSSAPPLISSISISVQMKDALLVAPANNYKGTTATATLSPDTHYNNNSKVRDQSMVEKASPAMAKVEALRCPRCDSANTKFCYYNNYSLAQPRHFCKACKRYWTRGGTLRNVPVGGGCRKNKRVVKKPAAAAAGNASRPLISPPPDRHRIIHTNSLPADAGRPGAAAAALYAHHALQQMASAASLPLVFDGLADPSYDLLPHLGLGVLSSNQDLGFQHLPPVNSILSDDNLLIRSSMLPSPSLFPSSIKHPMKQLEDQFDQSLLPFDTSADQLEASALTNGGINGMMKEVKLESSQSNNMMTGNSFSQNWQNSIVPSHVNPLDNFLPTPSVSMYWNSTTAAAAGGISWSDFNTNCLFLLSNSLLASSLNLKYWSSFSGTCHFVSPVDGASAACDMIATQATVAWEKIPWAALHIAAYACTTGDLPLQSHLN